MMKKWKVIRTFDFNINMDVYIEHYHTTSQATYDIVVMIVSKWPISFRIWLLYNLVNNLALIAKDFIPQLCI